MHTPPCSHGFGWQRSKSLTASGTKGHSTTGKGDDNDYHSDHNNENGNGNNCNGDNDNEITFIMNDDDDDDDDVDDDDDDYGDGEDGGDDDDLTMMMKTMMMMTMMMIMMMVTMMMKMVEVMMDLTMMMKTMMMMTMTTKTMTTKPPVAERFLEGIHLWKCWRRLLPMLSEKKHTRACLHTLSQSILTNTNTRNRHHQLRSCRHGDTGLGGRHLFLWHKKKYIALKWVRSWKNSTLEEGILLSKWIPECLKPNGWVQFLASAPVERRGGKGSPRVQAPFLLCTF